MGAKLFCMRSGGRGWSSDGGRWLAVAIPEGDRQLIQKRSSLKPADLHVYLFLVLTALCFGNLWRFFFSSSFSFWTKRFLFCRHISLGCQPDWLPTDFAWLPFPCLVLWYQTFLNCLSVSLSLFPKSAFGSASSGNGDIYQTSLSTVSPISAFIVVTKAGMTICKLPLKKGLNSRPRASPPLERSLWMLQ